jgi:choline transport protein
MAEEVKDAGLNVPKAMVWSFVLNGILGLFFIITYLFCLPSVEDALNDPTTFPFLYVFRQALSVNGVNTLTVLILLLAIACNIAFNASTSRQTFAFARDNGLPFPKWIAQVHPTLQIPANAITLTCALTLLLSLINIGSTVAFNAIISLQIVALMASYSISISCVLYRRLTNTLPRARWSLGRFGVPINVFGIAYSLFAFFWCFWPNSTPVDTSTFNWAVVLFVGTVFWCIGAYFVQGRKLYVGPVVHVEGRGEFKQGMPGGRMDG